MAPKVIHLSDEAHAEAKAFCAKHGLKLKPWVEGLILQALGEAPSAPAPSLRPVEKKKPTFSEEPGETNGPKPWEQPPFWKREQEEAQTKGQDQLERGGEDPPVGSGAAPAGA